MINQAAVKRLSREDKKKYDELWKEYNELWKPVRIITPELNRNRSDINSRIGQFCTDHKLIKE